MTHCLNVEASIAVRTRDAVVHPTGPAPRPLAQMYIPIPAVWGFPAPSIPHGHERLGTYRPRATGLPGPYVGGDQSAQPIAEGDTS